MSSFWEVPIKFTKIVITINVCLKLELLSASSSSQLENPYWKKRFQLKFKLFLFLSETWHSVTTKKCFWYCFVWRLETMLLRNDNFDVVKKIFNRKLLKCDWGSDSKLIDTDHRFGIRKFRNIRRCYQFWLIWMFKLSTVKIYNFGFINAVLNRNYNTCKESSIEFFVLKFCIRLLLVWWFSSNLLFKLKILRNCRFPFSFTAKSGSFTSWEEDSV